MKIATDMCRTGRLMNQYCKLRHHKLQPKFPPSPMDTSRHLFLDSLTYNKYRLQQNKDHTCSRHSRTDKNYLCCLAHFSRHRIDKFKSAANWQYICQPHSMQWKKKDSDNSQNSKSHRQEPHSQPSTQQIREPTLYQCQIW